MKRLHLFASLLTPLFLVSAALAQAADREPSDQLASQPDIAAARSRYLGTTELAGGPSGEASPQARRPRPRPSFPPHASYPRSGHPAMWSGGNPKHATIGALIGFGLGAAIGAKINRDNHGGAVVKAAFLVGSLGALVGAVAGDSLEPLHHRSVFRRRWPAQDDLRWRPEPGQARQTASAGSPIPLDRGPKP